MALQLANIGPPESARDTRRAITVSVRAVAEWLGDTPAVARGAYIDPRLISRYESDGGLATVPVLPPALPASADAEAAVAALLAYEQADHAAVQVGNFQMSGSCR